MGNVGSNSRVNNRRRSSGSGRRIHPPPVRPQPEITANQFIYPAVTTTPHHNYSDYYPPPPMWGRYPQPQPQPQLQLPPQPMPYVEHQKAVTIRNDVNVKKETLKIELDENNPRSFVVSFMFDATVDGSITIIFFAKEGEGCILTPMKEKTLPPVTVNFQKGIGQKFKQPAGTGIDFSVFEESDLVKVSDMDVYPLAVKADASSRDGDGSNETLTSGKTNSQMTQAVFEKEKGELRVKVVKQILWVNGMRYELQEIYGIGNSVESDLDGNDPGKECVICLSEPRDTTVLPCRHMCMCSGCAKVLRFQTNRCPICRQPVERLLEIKVGSEAEE
ncbi:hypothetical protein TanjilG_28531 [Lupinus angustifolius]|uniref:RING-type E3 ubiquitin transferase n=1 Tax=Lupinus angustifolius TaxID=3871 RepID=A0A394DCM4_LUPAN|nr:PREDICTED: probable E3 ubiquitin-protein ligase LOG2 [Lupinus angustifolius]OIW21082.1 hypothetical protein TanjilG_28531 [Lupinus angustifolius]